MALVQRFQNRIEHVAIMAAAVHQDCLKNLQGEVALQSSGFPVVLGGDGARLLSHLFREAGPKDSEVEMTGVIRDKDALTFGRLGVDPMSLCPADEPGGPRQSARNVTHLLSNPCTILAARENEV